MLGNIHFIHFPLEFATLALRDWGLSRAKTLGNSDSVQFAHYYSRLQNLVVPLKAACTYFSCELFTNSLLQFDVRTAYVIQQLNKCDQMSHWSYKPKLICLTIFTSSYVFFIALCSVDVVSSFFLSHFHLFLWDSCPLCLYTWWASLPHIFSGEF